jgi:hypothetical protein
MNLDNLLKRLEQNGCSKTMKLRLMRMGSAVKACVIWASEGELDEISLGDRRSFSSKSREDVEEMADAYLWACGC